MANIWTPNGNRVAALPPGPGDVFAVTTMFGQCVAVQPVAEYAKALTTAESFARQMAQPRPFTIKVLAMSIRELLAFLGITPDEFMASATPDEDAEFQRVAIDTCMAALRDSNEAAVRADAFEVLTSLGVIKNAQ